MIQPVLDLQPCSGCAPFVHRARAVYYARGDTCPHLFIDQDGKTWKIPKHERGAEVQPVPGKG